MANFQALSEFLRSVYSQPLFKKKSLDFEKVGWSPFFRFRNSESVELDPKVGLDSYGGLVVKVDPWHGQVCVPWLKTNVGHPCLSKVRPRYDFLYSFDWQISTKKQSVWIYLCSLNVRISGVQIYFLKKSCFGSPAISWIPPKYLHKSRKKRLFQKDFHLTFRPLIFRGYGNFSGE